MAQAEKKNRDIKHPKKKNQELVYVTISIPVDTFERLRLAQQCYKDIKNFRSTYEYIINRFLSKSGLGHISPDVYKEYEKRLEEAGPASKYFTVVTRNNKTEKKTWELKYYFTKEGEENIDANLGDRAPFYAIINGQTIGLNSLLARGWKLMNEKGDIIEKESAVEINKQFKDYREKIISKNNTVNKQS